MGHYVLVPITNQVLICRGKLSMQRKGDIAIAIRLLVVQIHVALLLMDQGMITWSVTWRESSDRF